MKSHANAFSPRRPSSCVLHHSPLEFQRLSVTPVALVASPCDPRPKRGRSCHQPQLTAGRFAAREPFAATAAGGGSSPQSPKACALCSLFPIAMASYLLAMASNLEIGSFSMRKCVFLRICCFLNGKRTSRVRRGCHAVVFFVLLLSSAKGLLRGSWPCQATTPHFINAH